MAVVKRPAVLLKSGLYNLRKTETGFWSRWKWTAMHLYITAAACLKLRLQRGRHVRQDFSARCSLLQFDCWYHGSKDVLQHGHLHAQRVSYTMVNTILFDSRALGEVPMLGDSCVVHGHLFRVQPAYYKQTNKQTNDLVPFDRILGVPRVCLPFPIYLFLPSGKNSNLQLTSYGQSSREGCC